MRVHLGESPELKPPQVFPRLAHRVGRDLEVIGEQLGVRQRQRNNHAILAAANAVKIANLLGGTGPTRKFIEHPLPEIIRNGDHLLGLR